MPNVVLLVDLHCPNAQLARAHLAAAFARARLPPRWTERVLDPACRPEDTRAYGSPTVLVDGRDVEEATHGDGASCRLYEAAPGCPQGAPSVDRIVEALTR